MKIFAYENEFDYIICKTMAILRAHLQMALEAQ